MIYRFSATHIKIPTDFFAETDKLILKFIWEFNRCRIAITSLQKMTKVGGMELPKFNTYHKATVIKTVWYWYKDRSME